MLSGNVEYFTICKKANNAQTIIIQTKLHPSEWLNRADIISLLFHKSYRVIINDIYQVLLDVPEVVFI